MKKRVLVAVAAHKAYRMPTDRMYLPLQVGAEGKDQDLGYEKDNTGDHISDLNPGFSELTGLYWMWKNTDSEYAGLVHYRRHFRGKRRGKDPFERVLRQEDIEGDLGRIRLFLPKKRRYYIETLYSHYAHTHYKEELDLTKQILEEKYPEYASVFDRTVRRRSGYMFNMMILERSLFDRYSAWLFDVLFTLRERIGERDLSAFQGRFYGRVSEIIFNVWLEVQLSSGIVRRGEIREIPMLYTEHINRFKKSTAFLKAKFLHKRYEKGF